MGFRKGHGFSRTLYGMLHWLLILLFMIGCFVLGQLSSVLDDRLSGKGPDDWWLDRIKAAWDDEAKEAIRHHRVRRRKRRRPRRHRR
jgi:hypothetical protein